MAIPRIDLRPYFKAATASPACLFWTFAIAHALSWTIVPTLVCPNAPLDVIENYAWGREWLMGTHKHPPMQAWWLEVFAQATGRAPWAHFLASQTAILIAFWAVWSTGRRMLGEKEALIGVLLLEGVLYYNFTSPEFNANILQLPFWALTGRSFYRAVKDNRVADWLLLGLWSACGLYSKYSTALFLLSLVILLLANAEARKRLRGAGPYLALITASLLFFPHVVWLFAHDFIPFTYAQSRLHSVHHDSSLLGGLVAGQIGALAPAALMFFTCFNRKPPAGEDPPRAFDRTFLGAITFGPFFLTFLLALVMGFHIHDMWGTPFWNFIGLWAIFRFQPKLSGESLERFTYGCGIVFAGILLTYIVATVCGPYVTHNTQRVQFPGRALADKVAGAWHDRYHTPLKYVIGDIWPAGNVAYYTPERPHVFLGDYAISPWVDPADLKRAGGMIVWCVRYCIGRGVNEQPPAFIHKQFPQAEIQPRFTLPRETGADVEPVIMDWAILPPAHAKTSSAP